MVHRDHRSTSGAARAAEENQVHLRFVGTESRLKLVIETFADLLVGSSDNPESRLAHLREGQQWLQQEIMRGRQRSRAVTRDAALRV